MADPTRSFSRKEPIFRSLELLPCKYIIIIGPYTASVTYKYIIYIIQKSVMRIWVLLIERGATVPRSMAECRLVISLLNNPGDQPLSYQIQ